MRKLLLLPIMLVAVVTAACGSPSSSSSSNTNLGPPVNFVGNSSCPTKGADPYNNGYAPNTNGKAVGQVLDEMPHTHVSPPTTVNYMHDPPTSGCHYSMGGGTSSLSAPVQPGVYNQDVPKEYWVHNLEHGYVVVLYNCPNGCSAQFDQLHSWYKALPADPQLSSQCPQQFGVSAPYPKVLVLPETTMPVKFAVVSWDWYDGMPAGLDINEVQRFYDNHKDQAPEGSGVC